MRSSDCILEENNQEFIETLMCLTYHSNYRFFIFFERYPLGDF